MIIKIEKSFLVAVLIVLGLIFAWLMVGKWSRVPSPVSSAVPDAQTRTVPVSLGVVPTKEVDGGEVSVAVTPLAVGESETVWKFQVATNTHTVDMSGFDPEKQIVLQGVDGKDILPSAVVQEGSGHHQQLMVSFPKVAKPWKFIVRNVAEVPAREFVW